MYSLSGETPIPVPEVAPNYTARFTSPAAGMVISDHGEQGYPECAYRHEMRERMIAARNLLLLTGGFLGVSLIVIGRLQALGY